jgi:hypothetical protein
MQHLEELIPLGTAAIISPLMIAAIIAILLSKRARANGLAFVSAAILASSAFVIIAALTTKDAGTVSTSGDKMVVLVLEIVMAVGFTVLGVVTWLTRPKKGVPAKEPSWLSTIDKLSVGKAFAFGLLMASTNSKNIPVDLKAGALIGTSDLTLPLVIGMSVLFALFASLGILLPTLLAATGSSAVTRALEGMKSELIEHNAVIMTVLWAMLAATQISHVVVALATGAFGG